MQLMLLDFLGLLRFYASFPGIAGMVARFHGSFFLVLLTGYKRALLSCRA